MKKKILYIDMDSVIVDFESGMKKVDPAILKAAGDDPDDIPGIFGLMDPLPGAIEAVELLAQHFDTYILSTASWDNPSAWSDKVIWVKKYFPEVMWKRLILSHHKNLNKGNYLIDDRTKNGAGKFEGEHIHFHHEGADGKKDWEMTVEYLFKANNIPLATYG